MGYMEELYLQGLRDWFVTYVFYLDNERKFLKGSYEFFYE